jgi:PAS domain S-box-containing protein
MDDNQKSKSELINELNILRQQLKKRDILSKEDRFKLAIIDRAPFSTWACNRNFSIVFWSAGTAKVYGRTEEEAIGKNYLDLFVSEEERERSAKDCIDVIDNGTELKTS